MDMLIYTCADGALLLVPNCCQPSIEAQHLFGPLELVGDVELDETLFDQQFDAQLFAHVNDATGIQRLLAAAHRLRS